MTTLTMKFGGTSVGSHEAIRQAADSFVIPTPAVPAVIRSLEEKMALELQWRDIDRVCVVDDVVTVTAVGAGMRGTPGIAQRIFAALGQSNINLVAIAQGSSECSVSLVVAADAIQQIHLESSPTARTRVMDDVGRKMEDGWSTTFHASRFTQQAGSDR